MNRRAHHVHLALATLVTTVLASVILVIGVDGTTHEASATGLAPDPTQTSVGDDVLSTLTPADLPDGCVVPNRHLTLYAVELPRTPEGRVRLGYGVTPETADFPGPTIEMIEGECLAITLVNQVSEATLAELRDDPVLGLPHPDPHFPLGVSLHVHGVKYTTASDGTMHTGSWVPPGSARTYVWYAEPRTVAPDGRVVSHGTAGYWWYHDHVAGTDHGTGGVGSGLFGALVVRRPGDPLPDHTYVVAMGDASTVNLRTYPDTDTCPPIDPVPTTTCFVAREGDRVEFVIFGIGNDFHTFHLHGHTWVDNRNGVLAPTDDVTRLIDVIPLGPSASFGFQIVAGASVGDGDWMIHCHVQRHSDLGMFTFLHVLSPDQPPLGPGSVTSAAGTALPASGSMAGARFRGSETLPVSDQRDLGYYCSLGLTEWAAARVEESPLPSPGL